MREARGQRLRALFSGAGASLHGVAEGAPRSNKERHPVGERNLPGERGRCTAVEEQRALINQDQDSADDKRREERTAKHAAVAQSTAETGKLVAGGAAHAEEATAGGRRGVRTEGPLGALVQASSIIECAIPASLVSSDVP